MILFLGCSSTNALICSRYLVDLPNITCNGTAKNVTVWGVYPNPLLNSTLFFLNPEIRYTDKNSDPYLVLQNVTKTTKNTGMSPTLMAYYANFSCDSCCNSTYTFNNAYVTGVTRTYGIPYNAGDCVVNMRRPPCHGLGFMADAEIGFTSGSSYLNPYSFSRNDCKDPILYLPLNWQNDTSYHCRKAGLTPLTGTGYIEPVDPDWATRDSLPNSYPPAIESLEAACLIELHTNRYVVEINYHGYWVPAYKTLLQVTFTNTSVDGYNRPSGRFILPSNELKKRNINTDNITVNFYQPNVVVVTEFPKDTYVHIIKDLISVVILCETTYCSIELPAKFFVSSEPILVRVFINDTFSGSSTFNVDPFSVCVIPHCVFCLDFIDVHSCLPLSIIALFWTMVSLLIVVTIILLVVVYYFLKRTACCGCCLRNVNAVPMVNLGGNLTRSASFMMFIVGALSASCMNGLTLSSDSVVCTKVNLVTNCEVTLNELLTLPGIGATYCINIMDNNKPNITVGSIQVEYTMARITGTLFINYYTSGWTPLTESHRSCPWETGCNDANYCSTFSGVNDPGGYGLIVGEGLNWPGHTKCDSQCGCAGCGCFSCDSSCVYSRWALKPSGPVYSVQQVNQLIYNPTIKLTITTAAGTTSQLVGLQSGIVVPTLLPSYQFNVLGSLVSSETIFADWAVAVGSNNAYFVKASSVNGPIAGSIGDIQSSSPSKLTTQSRTAFIFDDGIVTANANTYATSFTFINNGIDTLGLFSQLPATFGGKTWSFDQGAIYGLDPSPPVLLVGIKTTAPVVFSYNSTAACPQIDSCNVTGCYSCTESATVNLYVFSKCDNGLVSVSSSELNLLKTLSITTDKAWYTIRLPYSKSSVSDVITVSTPYGTSNCQLRGTLVSKDLVGDRNYTDVGNILNNDAAAITLDLINTNPTLFWTLIAVGIFVVVAIVLAIVLYCVCKTNGYQKV